MVLLQPIESMVQVCDRGLWIRTWKALKQRESNLRLGNRYVEKTGAFKVSVTFVDGYRREMAEK